jgi:hypothetical protein
LFTECGSVVLLDDLDSVGLAIDIDRDSTIVGVMTIDFRDHPSASKRLPEDRLEEKKRPTQLRAADDQRDDASPGANTQAPVFFWLQPVGSVSRPEYEVVRA